jgi:hypothetical protein
MLSAYIIGLIPGCDGSTSNEDGSAVRVRVNGEWRDATAAELLAAAKLAAIAANRAEARRRLDALISADEAAGLALGIYTPASAAPVRQWIGDTRAAVTTARQAINAAATVAEVEAVAVQWPAAPGGALVFDAAEFAANMSNAATMRAQADAAATRLTEIISGTFTNNAQRDAAIDDMAAYLRGIVRHIAARL